jgi:hypothetical protein
MISDFGGFTDGLHLFRRHANPVERVSSLGFPNRNRNCRRPQALGRHNQEAAKKNTSRSKPASMPAAEAPGS